MDYEQANEAAAVEHLHPALQDTEEPGAKRQRLHGDATELDGQQQPVGLHPQVRALSYHRDPHQAQRPS